MNSQGAPVTVLIIEYDMPILLAILFRVNDHLTVCWSSSWSSSSSSSSSTLPLSLSSPPSWLPRAKRLDLSAARRKALKQATWLSHQMKFFCMFVYWALMVVGKMLISACTDSLVDHVLWGARASTCCAVPCRANLTRWIEQVWGQLGPVGEGLASQS